ncbi:MAG: hypothetical protein AAFW68_02325, partial [Pseudomonadota bacterium]
ATAARAGRAAGLLAALLLVELDRSIRFFVALDGLGEGEGEAQVLTFTTNVGDEAMAGPDHALVFRKDPETNEGAPYIDIRAGLEARIARAVFYDLVALGETREIDGEKIFGVWSGGVFFPFEPASEVYA